MHCNKLQLHYGCGALTLSLMVKRPTRMTCLLITGAPFACHPASRHSITPQIVTYHATRQPRKGGHSQD